MKRAYIPRCDKSLSMAFQAQLLRSHCETVSLRLYQSYRLEWSGAVQPASYCDKYAISVDYRTDTACRPRPSVRILSPSLRKRDGIGCPHRYGDQEPCLYHPPSNEWRPTMPLAFTIVPWTSRWLYFYEIWLATGDWHGGGIAH